MARKVFFSFHYSRDIRRVVQIRNSWVVRAKGESQPFMDKADWETIKRSGKKSVENWIDKQLNGTSVTVVLIGAETSAREWVGHEIKRSYELGKGMIGIYIHNVKDPQYGTDSKGANPFDNWYVQQGNQNIYFSSIYPTYDWVANDGYSNLSTWIETAAKKAGR